MTKINWRQKDDVYAAYCAGWNEAKAGTALAAGHISEFRKHVRWTIWWANQSNSETVWNKAKRHLDVLAAASCKLQRETEDETPGKVPTLR